LGAVTLVVAGCSGGAQSGDELQTVAPTTVARADQTVPTTASSVGPATGIVRAQTDDGLITVDLTTGTSKFTAGVASADWKRVASVDNGVAKLVDASTGEVVREAPIPDGLHVAAISPTGNFAAFSDGADYTVRGLPKGRSVTRVMVMSSASSTPPQQLVLDGNLVPEAFSTDGRGLFVLDYVPAAAPDHYEVRFVDLATGRKTDVGARPKEYPAMQMQGNVRTSLYSPDREMLFTLYSEYGEGGHAFIHALNVKERWSYCIDLPDAQRFGDGQATLAISGNKLFVLGDSGQLAEIDAQPYGLTVKRTAQLPNAAPSKVRPTLTAEGSRLVVGHDNRVYFLDQLTLGVNETFTMNGSVLGLSGDGNGRVAVATPTAIDVFDRLAPSGRAGLDTKLPVLLRVDMD
jgi:hypothetical protein